MKKGQIGLVVRKCTCGVNPCICGSHPAKLADPEAHRRFVKKLFALVNAE